VARSANHSEDTRSLFHRYDGNPILTKADWPYPVNSVFNAGAVRLQDSAETVLLVRCEDYRGHSHLTVARSKDGVTGWEIDPAPTFAADVENFPEERWGLEDPRSSWVPELNAYAVVYVAYSHGGPGVSLALTSDFKEFERYGMVLAPEDKNAALLPRRFQGRWAMIHRPTPPSGLADMWISFSPDLRHWGSSQIFMESRRGGWWDARKVGLGPPPLETPEGWLVLYHSPRTTTAVSIYRLGLALLDREEPTEVLLRGEEWIFGPEESYERVGDVLDVVFSCGATMGDDGDTLNLYYGGADTVLCLATASMRELLAWLRTCGRPAGKARES
jgi:predicted GH43/DUF377 family glycosyl hydrolase